MVKTQLAAHYARTAWQAGTLDLLVWITASSRSAVVAGYAQAAVEILGADPGDLEAARTFLAWLEPKPQPSPCRWLVVLDDVADPVDLRGWWPPASPHGRTLATTRRKDAALTGAGRRLIEIGLFTETQALAYLTSALADHGRIEPEDELTALADDLGHLPLALSQAAAYLIDAGISCREYRGLLADRTRSLADAAPDVLPDDQTHTVAAAWSLSLDRADTLRPAGLARPALQLASAMDPNGIPEHVLTSQPTLTYLTAHRACSDGDQAENSVSGNEARAALRVLHRLSLIEHSPDTTHPRIRVHQLIQRATRESLSPIDHADAIRSAADSLLATVNECRDDRDNRGEFLSNAQAVIQNAQGDLWDPEPHPLLLRFGASLGADCQFDAALDHFRQLVEAANRRLGVDSQHTLAMRYNLSYWQLRAGDLSDAAAALEDLLGDAQRVVGSTDHLTLATRRVLANVKGEAGEVATAIAELAEVLEDAMKAHGAKDPFTLDVRHNLSHWQGLAGDSTLATDGIREVLSIRHQKIDTERMTEEEFEAILSGLTSLIEQRGRAGDAAGAVDQYAELVKGLGQHVGLNHGTVRSLRTSLAWWKGCSGDVSGAIADYTALLEESDLETHHPNIRALLHNLGYWKGKSGDFSGAIAILSALLERGLRELGPNHPDVRLTRLVLTKFHWASGTVLKLPPR
ncbi:tetratricopeptide repeat protein [Streptomyces europaeiscabiei]|uniref:tetratricopeptide repeat protein n=1 Tax=Streptomyces europaeiscabiei TaxID=146819 RepID=UPI0029A2852A|nr:tetratricopeptide repeat protein [Streptomyces europaeiscabiei]MDX3587277.1 tetratricopeptide repeat protein [Streptomyces europaeiscabiei]